MGVESKRGTLQDSRGPSTRRIKLLEEAAAIDAIARLNTHDRGSRDWARGENRPFQAHAKED